jgi:hypothetical protein
MLITLTNLSLDLSIAHFLGIVICIRGTIVWMSPLVPYTFPMMLSLMSKFFPFAKLNPNADTRLHAEVTLLHPTLLPFNSGDNIVHDLIPDVPLLTNTTVEFTGENLAENLEESSLNHGIEENSLGTGISETPASASAPGSVH